MSYNNSNKQTEPNPHPSGLIRALLKTGRQKGSSATPAPISPTPNRNYGVQGLVNKMNNSSLNQAQSPTTNRSARSSTSQSEQQQYGRNDLTQTDQSENQGRKVQEQNFHPRAESFRLLTQSMSSNQSLRSNNSQSNHESIYTAPGYGGPIIPNGPPQHHLRNSGTRDNLSSQGINMQAPISVSSMSAQMQKRFNELKQRIEGKPGVTNEAKLSLINDISLLSQEYDAWQRSLQQEMDRLQDAKESYYGQLQKGREQVRNALADRDRFGSDREALQRVVDDMRSRLQRRENELDETNEKWKRVKTDLTSRIKIMDEQLTAKRALWLESNKEPSAKREAMKSVVDPFSSPTKNHAGFNDSGYLGTSEHAPLATLEGNAPLNEASLNQLDKANNVNERRGLRRQPNLNTAQLGSERPSQRPTGPAAYTKLGEAHEHTGPRTPPGSQALIVHQSEQDVAAEYKADYQAMYGMIEGWVRTYCDKPCGDVDTNLHKTHPKVWEFLMSLTYPGSRRDAHVHCVALLGDPNARYWFIMRAAISYLVRDIINVKTWKSFNTSMDSAIDESMNALSERGLAVDRRQNYVDNIHRSIQTIVSHSDYNKFRSSNLNRHSKGLRDMLGPLLNVGCDRQKAGRDLGIIVIKAWDFSAKVFTSHLTFSVIFPELGSKFVAGTMIAKDQPNVNPVQLQINQTRLRLVITPVVTLRDDRGTTIRAKNLHNSFVLTMS